MSKKIILIDAYSIIYRSYYAFVKNPLKNSRGQNTSGIFGFLNTLEKIKKRFASDYIGLAFDAPGETFRDEVYEEYKATRPPTPEDLPFQVLKVKEICHHMGIALFELEGYEADDILATFAAKLKTIGEIYIVTSDKDLLQLVGDNIFVYDAYRDFVYDSEQVIKKFGVPPDKIAEYLALTGDVSDNVPGVPGIGPKRAMEILKKYSSFEEAINKDKRIVAHKDKALLSKRLTMLEYDVPMDVKAQDLALKKPDEEKLLAVLLDLEFHSFIKDISKNLGPEVLAEKIKSLSEIAPGRIVGISLNNGDEIYLCTESDRVHSITKDAAQDLLLDKNTVKVGYGLKDVVKRINIEPPLFDINIASWLLDPNRRSYSFEDIVLQNLHKYSQIRPATAAKLAFQLYPILYEKLEEQQELNLYKKIEEPLVHVLAKMEQKGIKIDIPYFEKLGKKVEKDISQIEKEIFELANRKFNIDSPKQLSRILFEDLRMKPLKKGKTHYSTSVEVLQQLGLSHPLPHKILKYRELSKIKSTYIDPLITVAEDGRIYTTFNQTGTTTGRLSSSNPNIQNIPVRTEIGRKVRKGFIADNGFCLISADYSQVELRLLAHISEDKNLIQAFEQGEDIHNHTASLVFNISEDEVDETKRRTAKVVNYGLIYGMSDYGFAQRLDIPQEQAVQFIQSYYNLYPEVKKWREQAVTLAQDRGYAETMFGRKRPLPEIHSRNRMSREFSKRAAINTPIQGTAADLIKLAMIQVEERLSQAKFRSGLLLSIHDELVFEIEEDRIDEAKQIIKESMEQIVKLALPIEVSIGVGKNWNQVH